jgi:tRNA/rRNA methyltransferase
MALHPQPRFILMETSHPGNVGAAARAIKVMGFGDLVLVRPRFADVLSQEETVAMASGAADVLTRARVVDDLSAALQGVVHLCATAMTTRDFGPPASAPRAHFQALAEAAEPGPPVAFIFGSERHGLSNEDVYRAHVCLSIPTHPGYGSLNLAQAVQLLAYEYRQQLGGYGVTPRTAEPQRADAASVHGALQHWETVLQHIGFLDPKAPRKLMPRLQQLLNRAQLTPEEVHILRGIARAVDKASPHAPPDPSHRTTLD